MTIGICGYSNRISVHAGETIRFMVSCDPPRPYRADLVRLRCGDLNPEGPGYAEMEIESPLNGEHAGRHQRIHMGSYVRVPASHQLDGIGAFTITAWLWPTTPGHGEQAILSCWDPGTGGGLEVLLDDEGALALRLGDGRGGTSTASSGAKLLASDWCLIVVSFDPETGVARLHQRQRSEYAGRAPTVNAERRMAIEPLVYGSPLLIAARAAAPTAAHYNGKVDSPRFARAALPLAEALSLLEAQPPQHLRRSLVGAWDFSQEIPSTRIVDVSGNGLHGVTVNLPARAMTGQAWNNSEQCWTNAPEHYGAIHFHDDDVYDAGWQPDLECVVPDTLPSGAYALRLRAGSDEDYIPFYVRAATGKPTARILYLAPTAAYSAYANLAVTFTAQLAELQTNRLLIVTPWEERLNEHPELGKSLYDLHSDGSGVCYSSRLRPILNMRPKVQTSTAGIGSMLWAYNADTHLTDWLQGSGFAFDVATDEDLDAEGVELLRHYSVVLTGTHPEYTSKPMLDALQDYLGGGGRLMYMGGNGFYWRVAYSNELPGVMEVRRAEDGTRAWIARPGEYYHSFTGEYGGLWRRQDRAPQRLAGTGFIAQGFDHSVGYRRTPESEDPRVAFAFEGIERDATIGNFGLIGGGAAGLEVDIADLSLGTPPHALVVAHSEELSDTYLLVNEEQSMNTPDMLGTTNARIRADIVFFETPNGGAVFSFSSIAWCGSLAHNGYDNSVSKLTGNVLRRFASPEPFMLRHS